MVWAKAGWAVLTRLSYWTAGPPFLSLAGDVIAAPGATKVSAVQTTRASVIARVAVRVPAAGVQRGEEGGGAAAGARPQGSLAGRGGHRSVVGKAHDNKFS